MPQESARAVAASASVAAQASLPQREAPPTNTQQMSQTFTVVAHNKRVPGKQGDFAQALASLDIADAAGTVLHHEEFPDAVQTVSSRRPAR